MLGTLYTVSYLIKPLILTDVGECSDSEWNNCHNNAGCSNTVGTYTCICNEGYTGDGENCTGKI